ncbi:hypothetical protein ACSBR1_017582 [Camellia fascicularis]
MSRFIPLHYLVDQLSSSLLASSHRRHCRLLSLPISVAYSSSSCREWMMREIQMMAALLVETLLYQLQNQLLLLVLPLSQCLPKILEKMW